MCEEHNTLKLLSGFHGDLFVLRYQSLGLTEPLNIISKSSEMISQMGKMFTPVFLKVLKFKLLEIAAFGGTIKSRVNIEASSSPFQEDERSKYL